MDLTAAVVCSGNETVRAVDSVKAEVEEVAAENHCVWRPRMERCAGMWVESEVMMVMSELVELLRSLGEKGDLDDKWGKEEGNDSGGTYVDIFPATLKRGS